jgi:hypothetical protein
MSFLLKSINFYIILLIFLLIIDIIKEVLIDRVALTSKLVYSKILKF